MSAFGGYRTGPIRVVELFVGFFETQGIVSTSGENKSSISLPV